MRQSSGLSFYRSRRAVAACVLVGVVAGFVTPMARAQSYAAPVYSPQPSSVYYQQAPQVVYQTAPQVVYQYPQPVYPPVVVSAPAPYYNPVWPAVAVGVGLGALFGGWGHGYGGHAGHGGGGHGGGHR